MLTGNQFYLSWHANYNDLQVICDTSVISRLPQEIQSKVNALGLTPVIEVSGDKVRATIYTFTKWGGVSREQFTISRAFPHQVVKHKKRRTIRYNCGMMF